MERLLPLVGMLAIMGFAYGLSTNRKAVRLKTVGWGLGLQLALALFVLRTDVGQALFSYVGDLIKQLLEFSFKGSEMVFGGLGVKGGGSFGFIFIKKPGRAEKHALIDGGGRGRRAARG